jgi:hypothetical protein
MGGAGGGGASQAAIRKSEAMAQRAGRAGVHHRGPAPDCLLRPAAYGFHQYDSFTRKMLSAFALTS